MNNKNELKNMMNKLEITQFELAIRTRISPGDISQIISGKRYCYPGWRKRIASALGVEEKEIFPEVQSNG